MADYVLLKKKVGGVVRKLEATNKKKINKFKSEGWEVITPTNLKKELNKGVKKEVKSE